jgi:hypothetical protein
MAVHATDFMTQVLMQPMPGFLIHQFVVPAAEEYLKPEFSGPRTDMNAMEKATGGG